MRALTRLLLVLSAYSSAVAQPGAISGVVEDSSRASVPGAAVHLRDNGNGRQWQTSTDASGAFRFEAVGPGDYGLEIEHSGFRPSVSRVNVGSRPPAPLRIVLALAGRREGVTVAEDAAQVSTESSENLNAISVNQELMANLPVFDQDYVAIMSRFLNSGLIGTGGVTLVVDGMEATRVPVSASAIQQVKINQDPYSAEFSRPGG